MDKKKSPPNGVYVVLSPEGKEALKRLKRQSGESYARIIDNLLRMTE